MSFIVAMGMVTSCSKDSNNSNNNIDVSIVGKWECTASKYVYANSPSEERSITYDKNVGGTFEFSEDGKATLSGFSEIPTIQCNYSITGNTLILIADNGNHKDIEIKKLTTNNLILYTSVNADGAVDDFLYEDTWEFKRIKT